LAFLDRLQKPAVVAATLLLALIWGGTFAGTKFSLQAGVPVGALLAVRFSIGAICLAAMMMLLKKPLDRRSALDGLTLGIMLTAIFWLQVDGLRFTTTGKSSFITGLVVIFTPMVSLMFGDRFRSSHALGAVLAAAGLYFLVSDPSAPFGGWGRGDSETLACAVLCGFHITLTARYSRRSSAWAIAFVQVAVVALLSCALAGLLPADASGGHGAGGGQTMGGLGGIGAALGRLDVWLGILYLAVLATALAFYMQTALQSRLAATEAAIIFTTEPVFAVLIAISGVVPGVRESLTAAQAFGACLIVGAMLLAGLGPKAAGKGVPCENQKPAAPGKAGRSQALRQGPP
jgi:drug/metabolite transporter (DMT)-like permease